MLRTLFLSLFALLFFSACKDETPSGTLPQFAQGEYDPEAVHLALLTDHDCLPLIYAARTGLFDSLGVKVQVTVYTSQIDADTAILGKFYDGGMTDRTRLESYGRRAAGLQTMWTADVRRGLFVCGALRINSIKTLRGRTVAVSRNSADAQALNNALRSARLKETDVYLPQIHSMPLRASMLGEEQFDATILTWPYTSVAWAAGNPCIYTQKQNDHKSQFVMKADKMKQAAMQKKWERIEKARRMAQDSLRLKGATAFSLILQKDYGVAREIADTLKF